MERMAPYSSSARSFILADSVRDLICRVGTPTLSYNLNNENHD
ncbi:hypothetical protein Pan97_08580 [Bremerella volcania]|uniref:Uncharacterized protein n=1 Tax=Bremerella volcania TaxID=2527984 RepID=A0A518C3Q4_9BACT|nr:hypothetical protein Pan97_08580 [Bremerella volcania]